MGTSLVLALLGVPTSSATMTTATRATTTTCLVLALLGVGNLLLAVSRHV